MVELLPFGDPCSQLVCVIMVSSSRSTPHPSIPVMSLAFFAGRLFHYFDFLLFSSGVFLYICCLICNQPFAGVGCFCILAKFRGNLVPEPPEMGDTTLVQGGVDLGHSPREATIQLLFRSISRLGNVGLGRRAFRAVG